MTSLEAVLRWYGVLLVVTLAVAPAVRGLCCWLPDRGASLLVPIGPLLVVWPVWFAAAAFGAPFTAVALAIVAAAFGLGGWAWTAKFAPIERGWLAGIAVSESAFLLLFLVGVWLRGYTPDLTGTEKPMEAAFLASSQRAVAMPPPDPWFAGESINYYYVGYVVWGAAARVADVPSTIAFNLALPTLFAATAVGAAGFVWNAVRPATGRSAALAGACFGAFFVAVAGNLYAPLRLLEDARATVDARWWDTANGVGWRASRIVCDGPRRDGDCRFPSIETINEFPFFSFLLGDLHPHVMALPLTVAVLGLALGWLRAEDKTGGDRLVAKALASGGVAGALYAVNSWDYPTLLFVLLAAILVRFRSERRRGAALAATALGASILAWLPFWLTFVPPSERDLAALPFLGELPILGRLASVVGVHAGERTSLPEYLTIFGVPVALGLLLVASLPRGWRAAAMPRSWVVGLLAFVLVAIVAGAPVLALAAVAAVVLLRIAGGAQVGSAAFVSSGLFALGFALSGGVEIFYLRDVFASRMNTLFKIYYQVWVLFGLASAVALVVAWSARSAAAWRRAVALAGAAALLLGSAYPLVATPQWTDRFGQWRGLDGIAYAAARHPDEHAAITWLRANADAGDVVVEAAGCSYEPNGDLPFNRVSAYTGVPTIVGWGNNHQPQWRRGQPDLIAAIPRREEDVAAIYGDPGGALAGRYGADWLYVGIYEAGDWQHLCPAAGPYPGIGAEGFPGLGWAEAFRSGDVAIYRRTGNVP